MFVLNHSRDINCFVPLLKYQRRQTKKSLNVWILKKSSNTLQVLAA